MVATVDTVQLKLISKSYKQRSGLWPMAIALGVGFLFSCLWLGVSIWMLFQAGTEFLIWGLLIASSTALYLVYLAAAGYKMIMDGRRQYLLELTPSELVLSMIDHMRKQKSTQMILLNDIKFGEYYPYPDQASIILHSPYLDLEVPLWPFGQQGQDVIDFLEGRGVYVVNVQFDDKFPE